MIAEEWIRANLPVVFDGDEDIIDWGNNVYTPIRAFLSMFENIVQNALDRNQDVRQAIRDNDNGRGFAGLV